MGKAARSGLPDIDKKKFLVPGTMLLGEFKYIIHKHLSQTGSTRPADQTIYIFANNAVQRLEHYCRSFTSSTRQPMVSCTYSIVPRIHLGSQYSSWRRLMHPGLKDSPHWILGFLGSLGCL